MDDIPKMHLSNLHRTRPLSRQLDLNLLDLFETVYRLRNLTQAGQHLGLTQPAVSRALGRLRQMYGDALFVRNQRGVVPTPFADELIAPVAQALNAIRATLERSSFEQSQQRRTFRVALSDVGERIFLPRLMEYLHQHAPFVDVEALSPTPEMMNEGLASGQIDLAIGYFGSLAKQLRQKKLFRERFVYMLRSQHPALQAPITREVLRALQHVVGGPEVMQYLAAVEKVLHGPQVKARVALRVHSQLCIGPIVAASDLVGLVPSNLAALVADHMPLQLVEPPVRFPSFDVTMNWHDRFHKDPANEWLRAVFVQLFEGAKIRIPPAPALALAQVQSAP